MTIPSSRSLILWISVFSITSPSADFGRLRKTSDFFGRLRTSSGIFGNDRVVFQKSQHSQDKNLTLISQKKLAGIRWVRYACPFESAQENNLAWGCSTEFYIRSDRVTLFIKWATSRHTQLANLASEFFWFPLLKN